MEKKQSSLAGILVVLVKIISKLVKSAKVVKTGLAGASLITYSYMFTWQFAVIIMTMLFVHESGHVWAMRKRGIKTKGFYFIPFVGGAAVAQESFKTRENEAYIAIMGPVWGFLLSLAVYGIYLITKNPLFAAAASWMALINLINLIPVNPLDGGRLVKSISLSIGQRSERLKKVPIVALMIASTAIIGILAMSGLWLFFFFACLGFIELLIEFFGKDKIVMIPMSIKERYLYLGYTICLAFVLYALMYITNHVPGSNLAMNILRDV